MATATATHQKHTQKRPREVHKTGNWQLFLVCTNMYRHDTVQHSRIHWSVWFCSLRGFLDSQTRFYSCPCDHLNMRNLQVYTCPLLRRLSQRCKRKFAHALMCSGMGLHHPSPCPHAHPQPASAFPPLSSHTQHTHTHTPSLPSTS